MNKASPESKVATLNDLHLLRKPLIPRWVKAAFSAAPAMGIVSAATGSFLVGAIAAVAVMATVWLALEVVVHKRNSKLP